MKVFTWNYLNKLHRNTDFKVVFKRKNEVLLYAEYDIQLQEFRVRKPDLMNNIYWSIKQMNSYLRQNGYEVEKVENEE